MEKTQVVIIGGGATGAGLLWDLALRGVSAVLLEKKDLANGATGRCHGLLHSGGRYVVKDPEAAKECVSENMILKRVAAPCVHDTGGLFVHVKGDDPGYVEQWVSGCKKIGIPTEELSRQEALTLEPNLPADVVKAHTCPDGHIDVFQLTLANLEAAVAKGARFRTYSEVVAIEVENQKIKGVRFRDVNTGGEEFLGCEIVVNAAGGWAQQVAALAGVEVPVRCDRGSLLIFNHCLTKRVVNRCRKPGDADILVPCGPVCILGTSSITVPGPENLTVTPEEVKHLLALGAELIPALANARLLRIFTGARPLYVPKSVAGAGGREISRNFALLDHASSDGIEGFISIVGGKLTTYRLMAKATADLICKKLAINQPCTTDSVLLREPAESNVLAEAQRRLPEAAVEKAHRRLGKKLAQVLEAIRVNPMLSEMVCECELVTRAELEMVLGKSALVPALTIGDIGRRTRLGFGPCQGTFCGYKAMLSGYQNQQWSASEASQLLEKYLEDRWKGQAWVPDGKQAEQLNLSEELFSTSYNFHTRTEVISHDR
ncbi:MAG: anaerobic glycerol-3-phosphate dehydrogenase subunit GlpA [Candidatus Korobacteraceae bacterium]